MGVTLAQTILRWWVVALASLALTACGASSTVTATRTAGTWPAGVAALSENQIRRLDDDRLVCTPTDGVPDGAGETEFFLSFEPNLTLDGEDGLLAAYSAKQLDDQLSEIIWIAGFVLDGNIVQSGGLRLQQLDGRPAGSTPSTLRYEFFDGGESDADYLVNFVSDGSGFLSACKFEDQVCQRLRDIMRGNRELLVQR